MCSADPGTLQGIEMDHPACNIQNDHFPACGNKGKEVTPHPNLANLRRFLWDVVES